MDTRPDEHPLLAESRAFLRWARRRWWLFYLVVLGQSLVWSIAWRPDGPPRQVRGELPPPMGVSRAWRSELRESGDGRDEGASASGRSTSFVVWPQLSTYADAARTRDRRSTLIPEELLRSPRSRGVVLLLHGSPGGAEDFNGLAARLANGDRCVLAVDLPGFGGSDALPEGYSIRSHARAVLDLLDRLVVERVHVVGWSMGGGVALSMIDLLEERADGRIASLTLMASVGVQEGEGSGSYAFEHFKYAAGFVGLVAAPELIPHFGLLGDRRDRYSFVRNFWDTDQRPLRGIMERVRVPTLVLHGRHDALVPSWVAEESHRLIPTSRLVMLDANHFLPFMQAEESAKILEEHFARHDTPGIEARTDIIDLAPMTAPTTPVTRTLAWTAPIMRAAPWWLTVAVIALLTTVSPVITAVLAALLCANQQLDLFEAATGVAAGWILHGAGLWLLARLLGERAYTLPIIGPRLARVSLPDWTRRFETHAFRNGWGDHFVPARRARGTVAAGLLHRAPPAFFAGRLAAILAGTAAVTLTPFILITLCGRGVRTPPLIGSGAWTELGVISGVLVMSWIAAHVLSRPGRRFIRARLVRLTRHEYWPAWLFYAPLYAYLVPLSLRHRGLMTPSCCNPGIEAGGGLIGESKFTIMRALGQNAPTHVRASVLPTHLIEKHHDPAQRGTRVQHLLAQHSLMYPVILKPNEGQRGYAVRLIRSGDEAHRYLTTMTRDAVLQPYHPGPEECGILWARRPRQEHKAISRNDTDHDPGAHRRTGFIFSITRKQFPIITGDGRRTLEELIDAHPRFRCQAEVYLQRFSDQASRVLALGETMRLAVSGNHCQGTLFRDGADLITPALEDAVDALAAAFPMPDGQRGGLDFGRFDVRYTTDDDLRVGRGFAVVELNGTFSESTNLYDPSRSLWWSYSILFRQWRLLYELGESRLRAGCRPMTARGLLGACREHFGDRDGPAVAD